MDTSTELSILRKNIKQDIFSNQEYGTVEHIVSTYGFIFGKNTIEYLLCNKKTTIRWKFRVYWRE